MLSNDESCDYNGKYIYIYNVGLTLVKIKLYTLMRNEVNSHQANHCFNKGLIDGLFLALIHQSGGSYLYLETI